MASIVSKLARAAFATRASPSAVGGIAGGARPAAAIRVSPAGGPNSEGEGRARSKSEVAPRASFIDRNPPIDENVFKSEEAMWAFYEHWCKFHGISRDRREMERRFKIFSNNARAVHEMNTSGLDCKLAMTRYVDMTKEEKSRRLGYKKRGKK